MKTLLLTIGMVTSIFLFSGYQLPDNKDNLEYEVSIHKYFTLELVSNKTTGYAWTWTNRKLVSIVDTFGYKYVDNNTSLAGRGGREVWNFKGIKPGVDTIKLAYCRSWDAKSTIQTKTIVVRVKKGKWLFF
jgi:predicted secreted protein